jgi:hypothetical protein
MKPISLFRVSTGDFLLCYNQCGFYVDKYGRRTRPDFIVYWSGLPIAFTFTDPYILAYSERFVEIRHAFTGVLCQVLGMTGLRVLNAEEGVVCVDGSNDYQHVVSVQKI